MSDQAMEVEAVVAEIKTPSKKAGATMVKEKLQQYGGQTALAAAACAVIVWLGSNAVAPVFEGQREINKANAEAARANAESVRKFADAVQSLQVSIVEQRASVQELQRAIADQSRSETSHHESAIRILQGIVAVQEDIARRLREAPQGKEQP